MFTYLIKIKAGGLLWFMTDALITIQPHHLSTTMNHFNDVLFLCHAHCLSPALFFRAFQLVSCGPRYFVESSWGKYQLIKIFIKNICVCVDSA